MNRDDAPTPATATAQRPTTQRPRRNRVFKNLAIVIASIVFALGVMLGALSKLSPSDRSHAIAVFLGWPSPLQALAVLGALVVIAAVALWYPIREGIANRQAQENARIGFTQAIEDTSTDDVPTIRVTVVDDVPAIRRSLENISKGFSALLALIFGSDPPGLDAPSGRQTVDSIPAPRSPRATQVLAKPQDDVQLTPPDVLIGRETELRWVEERLTSHRRDRDTTVIIGIRGIGKTALASMAIDRIMRANTPAAEPGEPEPIAGASNTTARKHFTDGIARLQCAGIRDPVEVVRQILERVDPKRRLPISLNLDTLRQISEELLTGKDTLIVLDGVEPTIPLGEVVRALRTDERSAHILITTTLRPTINVAPVESQLRLESLTEVTNDDGTVTDYALELFAYYAGKGSAHEFGEHLADAMEIVETLERHTYALQLIGARVQLEPHRLPQIAREIKELQEGSVPLELEGVLLPVLVAHTATVKALPGDARELLYAFAAFGTPEAGRIATHALGEALGVRDVDGAINTLVRHQLMESFETPTMPTDSDRQRLRIHTLLHAYIATHVSAPTWTEREAQAKGAIAAHFAGYIRRFDRRDPTRSTQRALSPDAKNIVCALDWAISHNQHAYVVALVHGMRRFWHDRWQNDKSLNYLPTAVESAELLAKNAGDAREHAAQRENAADLAFTLGRVYRRTGKLAKAEPLFQRDLQFRRQQRPRQYAAQAEALHQLAQLERSRGRMQAALRYCRQGLAVVRWHSPRRHGDITQEARDFIQAKALLLAQQGRIERSRGNLKKADKLFAQAFILFEQTDDLLEQGVALGYRGRIARVLGNLREADEYFARSEELARQVYDFRGMGIVATQRGRIDRIRGDVTSAKRSFEEGLDKAYQVLDRQAEAVNLNYLGRIVAHTDVIQAEMYFRRSLQVAEEINDRLDYGVTLGYLGRIARERGFLPAARSDFVESLRILREVEDRRGQALILAQLALVDIKEGKLIRADWRIRQSMRLIRRIGDKRSEGFCMLCQGQLYVARGRLEVAQAQFNVALQRAGSLQDRDGEANAQLWLGRTAEGRGDVDVARQCYDACRVIAAQTGNKRLWTQADARYRALTV